MDLLQYLLQNGFVVHNRFEKQVSTNWHLEVCSALEHRGCISSIYIRFLIIFEFNAKIVSTKLSYSKCGSSREWVSEVT